MARINIEEESWVRFYRLAEIMNSNIQNCVGTVALLWHRSQDVIKASGTFEEVADWCGLAKLPEPEQRCWINGLEKARFISSADGGLYLIHGNEAQIESRISKTNRAAKGGEALKKKMRELKRLKAGSKPATSRPEAGSKGLNAKQFNAVQGNAIQSKAMQDSLPAAHAEAVPLGKDLVGFYCEVWKRRYGINPPIRPQDAKALKLIGETNGLERTKELLSAYLRMNEAFFLTKRHDLATFSANLTGVAQFGNTGVTVTRAKLKAVEDAVGLEDTLRQIREEGI